MPSLNSHKYLRYPFRIGKGGPETSDRAQHVREQIEQVLFTSQQERVFRPHFGVGIRRLVFEPNSSSLWSMTKQQLISSLSEALLGEVDPTTLDVSVRQDDGALIIDISYTLATLNLDESYSFTVAGGSNG